MPKIFEAEAEISIHTPHAGSDNSLRMKRRKQNISIHTPHAGSDGFKRIHPERMVISIHTPHAGSDDLLSATALTDMGFQSTLPMRGVTVLFRTKHLINLFQSTLPMRGVTDENNLNMFYLNISIHTPHAGSDVFPLGL